MTQSTGGGPPWWGEWEPAPPKSVYRRTLIKATPTDGGAPLYGWLEDHIMPEGIADGSGDATAETRA